MAVSDPAHPRQLSEYKLPENRQTFCDAPAGQDDARVSYSSHNTTVLKHLALVTWHSSGFR